MASLKEWAATLKAYVHQACIVPLSKLHYEGSLRSTGMWFPMIQAAGQQRRTFEAFDPASEMVQLCDSRRLYRR